MFRQAETFLPVRHDAYCICFVTLITLRNGSNLQKCTSCIPRQYACIEIKVGALPLFKAEHALSLFFICTDEAAM